MTSFLLRISLLRRTAKSIFLTRNFTTTHVKRKNDPEQINLERALMDPSQIEQKKKLEGHITTQGPVDITHINGTPEEHKSQRKVRIYEPVKNCMQSGTDDLAGWELEFDNRERWENPLMGWAANGDPVSSLKLQFSTKEDAIAFCEKNGWQWFVQEGTQNPLRKKSYSEIYSWNRRTRSSTK